MKEIPLRIDTILLAAFVLSIIIGGWILNTARDVQDLQTRVTILEEKGGTRNG